MRVLANQLNNIECISSFCCCCFNLYQFRANFFTLSSILKMKCQRNHFLLKQFSDNLMISTNKRNVLCPTKSFFTRYNQKSEKSNILKIEYCSFLCTVRAESTLLKIRLSLIFRVSKNFQNKNFAHDFWNRNIDLATCMLLSPKILQSPKIHEKLSDEFYMLVAAVAARCRAQADVLHIRNEIVLLLKAKYYAIICNPGEII